MAKKSSSDVAVWLGRETPHVRKALENASRHFDGHWVTIDDHPVYICA